ncbi:MAG: two-component system phosphate regulon sensor histidine kinase PhoR [Myxococcota bacterium]
MTEVGGGGDALSALLVNVSPNGLMVTDADGLLRIVNPAVRDLIPIAEDAIGRPPAEVISITEIAERFADQEPESREIAVQHDSRELLVRSVALGDGGGRLVLLQDVTRFGQEERNRSEFVASVSHELRTPTTSIVGYAETLMEEGDRLEPDLRSMVEVIHRNALRLTALFEDLLSLARLDNRSSPLPLLPVRVAAIVSEVLDKWRPAADKKNISFQTAIPRGIRVQGNYQALVHLVGNLVENAVKYSHPGGLVTMRSWTRDGRVVIEVIDVGIGIDPIHHNRIFERFYRVDKGRTRAAGGTGLGLALVKRFADAMEASVEIRSRVGRGSVFRVWMAPAEEES